MNIIVSIGPTLIEKRDMVCAIKNGASTFRLPLGYNQDYLEIIKNIRETEIETKSKISILLDFPSSRPRFNLKEELCVSTGDSIIIERYGRISIDNFDSFFNIVKADTCLSSHDGSINFRITEKKNSSFSLICISGHETIKSGNSLSIQSDKVGYELITNKEIALLEEISSSGYFIDEILFSFSESESQINLAKKTCENILTYVPNYIAKIESKEGVFQILKIANCVDAIMIGRGDLSVNVSDEFMAFAQEHIAKVCHKKSIMPILATQLLNNFVLTGKMNPLEVNGLSLAVKQGYLGFMLGKETVWSERAQDSISKLYLFLNTEVFRSKLSTLSLLNKPRINKKFTIAIEGHNGCGKSTIVKMLAHHYAVPYNLGIPNDFLAGELKYKMIAETYWEASCMYFLAGVAEKLREIEIFESTFSIIERSFWSTLSVHAAFNIDRLEAILNILQCINEDIFEPSLTIILRSSFEQCREQVLMKENEDERILDDLVGNDFYYRKEDMFYDWLTVQRENIFNINTCNRDVKTIFQDVVNVIDGVLSDKDTYR